MKIESMVIVDSTGSVPTDSVEKEKSKKVPMDVEDLMKKQQQEEVEKNKVPIPLKMHCIDNL